MKTMWICRTSEEEKFLLEIQTLKWTTLYMSTLYARNLLETCVLSAQNRKGAEQGIVPFTYESLPFFPLSAQHPSLARTSPVPVHTPLSAPTPPSSPLAPFPLEHPLLCFNPPSICFNILPVVRSNVREESTASYRSTE